MGSIGAAITTVLMGVVGLAIVAVLVSSKAKTSGVIESGATGFSKIIGAAVAPVSGSSTGGYSW